MNYQMYNSDRKQEMIQQVSILFREMHRDYGEHLAKEAFFGSKGVDAAKLNDAISSWADRFLEAGYSPSRIEKGIARMKDDSKFDQFPPKLRQFVSLCKESYAELCLPEPEEAFAIATGLKAADNAPAVVLYAIQKTGHWELRTSQEYAKLKPVFFKYYDEGIDKVKKGEALGVKVQKKQERDQVHTQSPHEKQVSMHFLKMMRDKNNN